MGILKAGAGALGGAMAEQWLEHFSCGAMHEGLLLTRGVKQTGENSANVKGEENFITDGSVVLVADGQCAFAVEQGKVIGTFLTPGEHRFTSELSKGLFSKGPGKLSSLGKQMWERVGYGGDSHVSQYVIYMNLLEQTGVPFACVAPIRVGARTLDMDSYARVTGVFSFRITDPLTFYQRVCGVRTHTVTVDDVKNQLSEELKSAFISALGAMCERGVRPAELPGMTEELGEEVKRAMTDKWVSLRGFSAVSVAISSIVCGDMRAVQRVEKAAALTNPRLAAATLVGATAEAMAAAASNSATRVSPLVAAVTGPGDSPPPARWRCACGRVNDTPFCPDCGAKRE
ncbi:MAG: SPFH domain-containing protein [Clostridia bacterium]|nr:SPFH domain-containing protein [Clostridia bacterium]